MYYYITCTQIQETIHSMIYMDFEEIDYTELSIYQYKVTYVLPHFTPIVLLYLVMYYFHLNII